MAAAIITGGGGALGKGIADALSKAGFNVVLCDLLEVHAREVSEELGGLPWKVLDVTRLDDVRRVFAEIAAQHGGIDALVNCAGGAMALGVPRGRSLTVTRIIGRALSASTFTARSIVRTPLRAT